MVARKFQSEFAISLFTARWQMLWPNDLVSDKVMDEKGAEVAAACHVYLICKRPAPSFDPKTFVYKDGVLAGRLAYRSEGQEQFVPFSFPFPLVDGATELRLATYPHREFITYLPNGEGVRYVPAHALSVGLGDARLKALEVLYVGQAYAEGKRSALDRLRSHTTLQKILADAQYKHPDDEIALLTFEYCPYRIITMIDGLFGRTSSDMRDHERFISVHENPLSEQQQICLAEAGLIRYFSPPYNEIYKESFPATDQKILSECYNLDFSGLIVEIDTSELRLPLYSHSVSAALHHTAKFDLIDPNVRQSFFTFGGKRWDGVIAPSR